MLYLAYLKLYQSKKNDTANEYLESGINVLKAKIKTNKYINMINNNRKISYIFNHKARYNNLRDIEIFKRLPQGETQHIHRLKI